MARPAAFLRWKSRDVGRFLRGIRSVGHGQGISAPSRHHRSGGGRTSALRLSESRQRRILLRHAVVHLYQRSRWTGEPFRRFKILADKISRRLQKAYRVQRAGLVRRQSFEKFPADRETSDRRCLLRRNGANPGAAQKNVAADFDDYGAIRRR